MTLRFSATTATALALLSACVGTETGNPPLESDMAINAHSSEPARAALRQSEGGVAVDRVWVTFGPVGLVPADDCEPAAAITSPLGTGDHAASEAAFVPLTLPRTSFCAGLAVLEATPEPLPDGAPPALSRRALVLEGRLPDGTPFQIVSGLADVEITIPAEVGSFTLEPGEADLLLGLDVARWLDGVELASVEPGEDGWIVLDDTTNTALRDAFDARVAGGMELYRDDGDGQLDRGAVLIGRGTR